MLHTNHGELLRIFDTFCRVWRAGGQATLTTSTEGGLLKANMDIQLGPPTAACPGAPPLHLQRQTAWTSTSSSVPAPGHPEAGNRRHRRRRRHRGPAAKARSNARAAAHQASLAAVKVSTAPVPAPPPPPPPPPATARLIKVVERKASSWPTFSQLDGEGGSEESDSELESSPPPSQPACYEDCDIPFDHCDKCRKCEFLCVEHSGCDCDCTPDGFWHQDFQRLQYECAVCFCRTVHQEAHMMQL